ncbi:MAG: porin [Gammaproteobacteria bacterium]|nr:porin [Gammaproteobacteria bacterium]
MNKKLLAIAVGAAMVAGSTAVMADSSVYGKINMGIAQLSDEDDDVVGPPAHVDDSGLAIFDEASRLGAKGSADLGNGLKAIFKMEGTVDMDGGGAFNFNRDSYVGLKGGFGQVTIGNKNTSYKNATGKMDLFADMWGDTTGSGFGTFDLRTPNQVQYSGKFGMVGVSADMDFAENAQGNSTNDQEKAGLTVAVMIAPMKGLKISIATATCGGNCGQPAPGSGADVNDTATKLGVQWKGGNHTVNVVYKAEKDDDGGTDNENMNVIVAQYGMKMGMNAIQFSYSMLSEEADDSNATQMSAAFVHNFSKSTKAYVAYSAIANDDAVSHDGRLDSGTNLDNTQAGSGVSSLAVGVTHKF